MNASISQSFFDQPFVDMVHGLGILFCILIIENMIIGIIIFLKNQSKSKDNKLTDLYFTLKNLHKVLIFTGVLQTGWELMWQAYIFYSVCILTFIIVLERKKILSKQEGYQPSYRANFKNRITSKPELQEIINMLNAQMPSSVIMAKFPHVKWLLEGNSVFDVTDFHHPGGNYLITKTLGRQMGQFLFAGHSLEEYLSDGHHHSQKTFELLEELKFGEIDFQHAQIFVHKEKGSESKRKRIDEEMVSLSFQDDDDMNNVKIFDKPRSLQISEVRFFEDWVIVDSKQMGKVVYVYYMKSKHLAIRNNIPGTMWMGRHFLLKFNKQQRQYGVLLHRSELNVNYRTAIINYFNKISQNDSEDFDFDLDKIPNQSLDSIIDTIQFVIKIYEHDRAFSLALYNQVKDSFQQDVKIEGPRGQGLLIKPNQLGHYVFIVGGTGILPFLDFFFYLLKQAALRYFKMKNEEVYKKFQESTEQLDETIFTCGFQVTLYAAWQDVDEYYGKDILETLYKLTQEMELQEFFKATIRFSQIEGDKEWDGIPHVDSYFDKMFFQDRMDKETALYLVVGPQQMLQQVPFALKKLGVKDEQIYFP